MGDSGECADLTLGLRQPALAQAGKSRRNSPLRVRGTERLERVIPSNWPMVMETKCEPSSCCRAAHAWLGVRKALLPPQGSFKWLDDDLGLASGGQSPASWFPSAGSHPQVGRTRVLFSPKFTRFFLSVCWFLIVWCSKSQVTFRSPRRLRFEATRRVGERSKSYEQVSNGPRILTAGISSHNDAAMRTTVTLEPEAERLLRDTMRRTGQSFKQVLNHAVVRGLASERVFSDKKPFVVSSRPTGLRAGYDAGRFNSLVDELEADAFVTLTREPLSQSKDG